MHQPLKIDPAAIYDDTSLSLSLGITTAAIHKARKNGSLRFHKIGVRTFYFGQWVLDWLVPNEDPRRGR